MSEPEGKDRSEPSSFWHRRRPGIRYIYSFAAIIGGIVLAVRYAGGSPESNGIFIGALFVVGVGIISIPVFWWMDKRRL